MRDDSQLDLNGWVTLTNQSGAAYPNAKLQLVAGDLNRVRDAQPLPRAMVAMAAKVADAAEMQQESLFEYHLYTLQRPTTLAENQTKQVALMSATRVPVKKEFLLRRRELLLLGAVRRPGAEDEGRRVRRVRQQGRRPGHSPAQGRDPRLQEGRPGQCAVRRRGPHRPHAEERNRAPEAGRCLRRDRRQEADRFPETGRQRALQLRVRVGVRNRAEERQAGSGHRHGARADAGRLDDGDRIAAAHQGGVRHRRMEGERARRRARRR